ncbi:MAG: right-handed parallel beta-helix repeat-containing protein, partial [Armatimonadota bacterium]
MRILIVLLCAVLVLTVLSHSARAAEYYLSPDGDDNAVGDRDNPWLSISRANETLEPADTAVFLPGDYTGTIEPQRSGTPDAPITYRSARPWAARLVADGVSMLMKFNGHEHIIIEGFEVDGQGTSGWFDIADCHYLTIRGCTMRRARPTLSIRNCTHIKLLDNVFSKDTATGDTLRPLNCSQMLIEGNSFTRVGHCPLVLQEMVESVVRGNVFRAEWGRNYSFWASGRLLIEGNIITRARDSAWSADPVAK